MKIKSISLTAFACASIMLGISSCGNDKNVNIPKQSGTATTSKIIEGNLPNYRYVDLDTILDKYNLAKDYNEEMLRMQNNIENTARQKEGNIQSYVNKVQQQYQNNSFLTQADQQAIQKEQEKIANMQNQAQREMANLQNNYQTAAMKAQQTINDSIEAFIKDYNAKHGYDAIFFKAATIYINPALDVTEEVIEGLNARYNKVKK